MNLGALSFWVLLSTFSYQATIWVLYFVDPDHDSDFESDLPKSYWLYNIVIIICTFFTFFSCLLFLDIAIADYSRRNVVLNDLTNALELDFETKNTNSVRYPTINFCDSISLATWLKARRLAFNLGGRYTIRIHFFVLYFLVIALLLIFAFFGYIIVDILRDFKTEQLVQLGVYGIIINAYVLRVLLVGADLNQQTIK